MDRKELMHSLQPFKEKCAENARPLTEICLVEAYPGDNSTSYIVQVKAPWIDNVSCYDAIDFLFDILWETTSVETRKNIFFIKVLGSADQGHCISDTVTENNPTAKHYSGS